MFSALTLIATIGLLAIPTALVCLPYAVVTGNANPLYKASLGIVRIAFRLAGIRVQVEGLERVPAHTACIFMSNHVSNLDPPALFPRIPGRTSAFVKRSLTKVPVFGYGLKLGDFGPVDRDGRVESAMENVAAARRVLEKGLHITTFVEGTRSPDGRLLPFKKGPFYLAMESGAPVVPVTIVGTHHVLPTRRSSIRAGEVSVVFHPPLDPRQFSDRDALLAAVRDSIASALPTEYRA